MVSRCHKDCADSLLIRVIYDISEQQQNLLETLWPNVLICCRNVRGPARKQNMSKVTVGKWQSWGEDSPLCYFWALGLPFCQGGNGHKGPWLYVQTTQRTGEQSMFINFTTHTEESLCRPFLQGPFPPESVLHRCPRVGQAPGHCPCYWYCHPHGFNKASASGGNAEWQPLF